MIAGTRYRLDQQAALQKRLSQGIARDMSDIATRTRLSGPSDDPAAASRIAQIQKAQSNETTWSANARTAYGVADRMDTSLNTLQTNLTRAKTLMLQASNETLSPADRASIAVELRGIAVDVAALSQEKDSRGQPLYATGTTLRYPVGDGVTVAVGGTRTGTFDGIVTADGPKDLSAILEDAALGIETAEAVRTDPDALPPTVSRGDATKKSLAELDVAYEAAVQAHAEQGVRGSRLESIMDRFETAKTANTAERSGLEDTDIDETVIKMKAKMTALEAAQAVLAKVSQTSLFDLIR